MATGFDPYHKWLAIPPTEQPPNLYRLLGLHLFETDPDVIDTAAEMRLRQLRSLQGSKHVELSEELLNEVAAARFCLLKPEKRAAYDSLLRAQIARKAAPQAMPRAGAEGEELRLAPPERRVVDPFDFVSTIDSPNAARREPAAHERDYASVRRFLPGRWWIFATPVLVCAAITAIVLICNPSDVDKAGPKLEGVSTALLSGGQASGSVHGSNPAGEPSIAKSQKTVEGEKQSAQPSGLERTASSGSATSALGPNARAPESGDAESSTDAPENRLSEKVPVKFDPTAHSTSGKQFPLGKWVDVLSLVDPDSDMVVAGNWSRDGDELSVEPSQVARVAIPVAVDGGYDFEVEFTRVSGNWDVNTMLRVGAHRSMVILSGWAGRTSGLILLRGRWAIDPRNPIAVRPGHLENGHRYRLLVSVRIISNDHASIDVSLDGEPYLPHWEGRPADLGVARDWSISNPALLGLGARQSKVVFHSARLKMISGSASIDTDLLPAINPSALVSARPSSRPNPSAPNSDDSSAAASIGLPIKPQPSTSEPYSPATPASSESWAAQATALVQSGKTANTPADRVEVVRKAMRMLHEAEGANRWSSQALDLVQLAENVGRATNEGTLIGATLLKLEARIRRAKAIEQDVAAARETLTKKSDDPAANSIVGGYLCFQMDNWAEGLPHLAKGSDPVLKKLAETEQPPPTTPIGQLKLADSWRSTAMKRPSADVDPWCAPMRARATYWYRKSASDLAGPAAMLAQKRIAEEEDAEAELTDLAAGRFPLPLGRWIDILRLVDTGSGMVIAGSWSRNGQELAVQPAAEPRVAIPVAIKGSYDVMIDFSRTSGRDDVNVILPIGSHSCIVTLSSSAGRASGLAMVEGRWPIDSQNPTAARPGTLLNGRRYQLLVSVRVSSGEQASIDVALNGRGYLHWLGDPATLAPPKTWGLPDPSELGFGAHLSRVVFHGARLKIVSGIATLDSALASANH